MGPGSDTPDVSCLTRGLQESWTSKCLTKGLLCSTCHCTDGKQSPERESNLPMALQPYHSWGRPGSMAPAHSPPRLWTPHLGEVGCWAHTRDALLAACLVPCPACCPHTPTPAAGLTETQGLDPLLHTQSTPPSEAWGDDVTPTKCPSALSQFAGNSGHQPPHSTWQTLLVMKCWFPHL